MSCTFCEKSASKLVKRSLCDCCLTHMKCCDAAVKKFLPVAWEEDAFRKVECAICLEEYQENELQQHREVCIPRVVFRCSLCDEDYLNQESLYIHLRDHKIVDEKREFYCQEKRLTYKQHICVLCTEQRSYRESYYWQHIHEDHDGFYLHCFKCGESFRSKKRKADHDLNNCESSDQIIPFSSDEPEEFGDEENSQADQANQQSLLDSDSDVQIIFDCNQTDDDVRTVNKESIEQKSEEIVQQPVDKSIREQSGFKCTECNKEFSNARSLSRHIECSHRPSKCEICHLTFKTGNQKTYHMMRFHSNKDYQCMQCLLKFRTKDTLDRHLIGFHHRKLDQTEDFTSAEKQPSHNLSVLWSMKTDCPICHDKFKDQDQVSQHVERIHKKTFCTLCRLTFANADKLAGHSCSICPHCNKGCYSRSRLINHIEVAHEKVTCDICEKPLDGKRRLWHHKQVAHSEPRLKCSKCSQKFHHASEYQRHRADWCLKNECKCKLCGHKFDSPALVAAHMEEVHQSPESEEDERDDELEHTVSTEENDDTRRETNESKYFPQKLKNKNRRCKVAAKVTGVLRSSSSRFYRPHERSNAFKILSYLNKHQTQSRSKRQTHADLTDLTPSKELEHEPKLNTEIPGKDRQSKRNETVSPSDDCGKSICNAEQTQKLDLKMESSAEETRLHLAEEITTQEDSGDQFTEDSVLSIASIAEECPHCKKMIKSTSLGRHLHEVHTTGKCRLCGNVFQSKRRLGYHMLICHTEPKRQCPHCPDKFHVKSTYDRHVASHKEKLVCKLCRLRFRSVTHLSSHVKQAHKTETATR